MDGELKQLEEELANFAPSPLSEGLLKRMSTAMERWEEQPEEVLESSPQVIPFPEQSSSSRTNWSPFLAAAAAIALFAALLGGLLPKNENNVQQLGQIVPSTTTDVRQASFVPVDVQQKVSSLEANVVTDPNGMPHQIIRVVRENEARFQQRGVSRVGLKVTRPQVEYYVVPVTY